MKALPGNISLFYLPRLVISIALPHAFAMATASFKALTACPAWWPWSMRPPESKTVYLNNGRWYCCFRPILHVQKSLLSAFDTLTQHITRSCRNMKKISKNSFIIEGLTIYFWRFLHSIKAKNRLARFFEEFQSMSTLAIPSDRRHKIVSGADLINTGRFPRRAPKEQFSRGRGHACFPGHFLDFSSLKSPFPGFLSHSERILLEWSLKNWRINY